MVTIQDCGRWFHVWEIMNENRCFKLRFREFWWNINTDLWSTLLIKFNLLYRTIQKKSWESLKKKGWKLTEGQHSYPQCLGLSQGKKLTNHQQYQQDPKHQAWLILPFLKQKLQLLWVLLPVLVPQACHLQSIFVQHLFLLVQKEQASHSAKKKRTSYFLTMQSIWLIMSCTYLFTRMYHSGILNTSALP